MNHGSFYRNAAWQYGLQIAKYILPFITLPYLTRVLAPEGYAVYAYVLSFMTFVQVFVDFGFNLSGTKRIVAAETTEMANREIGAVSQARLILVLIAGVVVAMLSLAIPIMRSNLMYVAIAYLAVCGRGLAPDFVFQGKENMSPITTRYLVSKGVSTALTFVVVHTPADLLWLPVLDLLASVIALVWSFASAKRLFGTTIARVSLKESLTALRESALYCASNISSAALSGFITLMIGIVITDSAQISFWSLSITVLTAVQSLYTPIMNSLYPHMVVGGDYGFARKIGLIALPFVTAATLIAFFGAEFIMLVLGGNEYVSGANVLKWLSPILLVSYYSILFGWPMLGAAGKVKEVTRSTVIAAASGVIMVLAGVGAGFGSIVMFAIVRNVSEVLMMTLRMFECYRAGLLVKSE